MTTSRAIALWFLLLVISIANGTFREAVLRPRFSELTAHQFSCATGILLILTAVSLTARKWPFRTPAHAWRTGSAWLASTIAFEFVFGHFVIGHPWSRLLHDYAIWDGRLWIAVLAAILCAPIISRSFTPSAA
ncbi:MAG: hypothetical protein IH602_04040 [Bryobacteraceae bacterium]|nr:hypothetical protein [Bryobacteraceae bacterium]